MKHNDTVKTTSASSVKISGPSVPPLHADSPLLDIDDLSVVFGGEAAISDISFCLHRGEFVGLIGPNGAGKTTLLKAVLGLQKPTAGTISRPAKAKVGYVPQRGALYSGIVPVSVLEVVRLSAARTTVKQAIQALKQVGMEQSANTIFTTLSGGQQQRVAIAKALAGDANLLVLDEPATGIDERAQAAFYGILQQLQAKGITIVMVSHEVDTVLSLVTRVICLNRTILYDGRPEAFETEAYLPLAHTRQHIHLHHNHGTDKSGQSDQSGDSHHA